MKTLLYNPIFINPQAYYVFPRLTKYLQPDNESTTELANYIGTIEVKVIAYGDTNLKRTYTHTSFIDLSEFKNTWIRISLFTKVGSCVLGEWKIGDMETDLPYIEPEVLASLKAVVIVGDKTNNDPDRAIIKNLVDPDNPFVISNAAYTEGSGYADKGSPYYGAFVTDGINDLITSTKTVQEMGITDEVTVVSMIHQIDLNSTYTIATTNYIENSNSREHVRSDVYNYGKTGIYGYSASLINNTKSDIKNILGDEADYYVKSTNSLQTIFDAKFSVVGRISELIEASQVAWYWTIIANKVLTTDQINQVIAYFNLDGTLNPDILCDIEKQGITNENHAEFGDKLIDFSGNGRDIQLNNIAWKGDSGIGKYEVDFTKWLLDQVVDITIKYSSFNIKTKNDSRVNSWVVRAQDTVIPSMKVKVTGMSSSVESLIYRYSVIDDKDYYIDITSDGIYELPQTNGEGWEGFRIIGKNFNISVEQIPSHAGALCLDGINDFGKVTGMPIYKDYTFIIDYERISYASSERWVAGVVSKSHVANQGAFILMTANTAVEPVKQAYSFGGVTSLKRDDFTRALLYQSKYKCGDVDLTAGEGVDSDTLWLGTFRDNDKRFFNGAIYSLMSFPYSMSEFLIERQLKKHKLGTLYPDMVEFRPIVKSNLPYSSISYSVNPGEYISVDSMVTITVTLPNTSDKLMEVSCNAISDISISGDNGVYEITGKIVKSPQKINITIDEYIRYEDIVQPYPSLFTLIDYDTEEVYSWGSKLKVGARFKGNVVNLLPNMYEWQGDVLYNGEVLNWGINPGVVAKEMVFSWNMPFKYLIDNNEPKVILSPRLLRIPNSSYKILGYIPDISGHGNHGKINNSAYAEGSGVNEDGSYQFDGVDDFVTIPTIVGGKQVLMKMNWQNRTGLLYDQRKNGSSIDAFAILNVNSNNSIAYNSRNTDGETYIDGILNKNIVCPQLYKITHSITIINQLANKEEVISPTIGSDTTHKIYFSQMSLYDFMLFDDISTEDKIKELNEYVGIEAKVELPPYYWDAYGKTNLDADKATIQQRGVAVGDYDLTNTNFAYDKMSGFGGYTLGKFTNSWSLSNNSNSISIVARNPYDITLKKLGENSDWEFNTTELKIISNPVSVKFKSDKNIRFTCDYHYYTVGGNSEGAPLGITSKDLIANEDTIITISPISQENIDKYNIDINRGYYLIYFQLSPTLAVNEEVTIEMLPLYPNGLVYDGVDDYSKNENIPVLTDYTIIAKRLWINKDNPLNEQFIHKGAINTPISESAFMLEYEIANDTYYRSSSYGGYINIERSNRPERIVYQTSNSYNGTSITKGSGTDTTGIVIGGVTNNYWNGVFYKLMLYSKTLPLLQINYLKNLMERDEIIDLNNPIFIQE